MSSVNLFASLGVGKIGIVDNDKVELSNLNRQIIYNVKDIGKYKVDVAKNKIKLINKNTIVKSFKIRINKQNIEKLIKNFDIICDGTDNFKTRLLVNDHTLKQKKILISAAVSGFDGVIYLNLILKKRHHVTDVLCQKFQSKFLIVRQKVSYQQ